MKPDKPLTSGQLDMVMFAQARLVSRQLGIAWRGDGNTMMSLLADAGDVIIADSTLRPPLRPRYRWPQG